MKFGGRGQEQAGMLFVRAVTERRLLLHASAAFVFSCATVAGFVLQYSDRPRSAAVVYVLGVTLVGALEGFWGGLAAALLASFIYNFFLSDPAFRLTVTSWEELTPLIAFNVSAGASGLLTGWLKDRALAAERANRRVEALFELSTDLQQAVEISDVAKAVRRDAGATSEIFVLKEEKLVSTGAEPIGEALARRVIDEGLNGVSDGVYRAYPLAAHGEPLGALVLAADQPFGEPGGRDMAALLNVVSLAVERCLLLERLSGAELIRRSEEFKTALLSSVSHDLRTPLSAIATSASSLARFGSRLTEDTQRDLLATIEEQCERLNRYTTNLLNLGRLQAGLDSTRFVTCDAIDVMGAAIGHVRALHSGHEIRKSYELATATVMADPVMLEQVFYNLLENAVRYSPALEPITVSAFEQGDRLIFRIEDRGPGIPAEERQRIFERFYRGSRRKEQGTGLGLSIAKGFVEAFGGSIDLEPGDSGGTVVTLAFPLVAEAALDA